jgi:mono/diheme cytochrome c family protein
VAPAIAQSPLIQRGQKIAEQLCARCHSVAMAGDSPMVLAPPFRLLPQRYPVEHLAEALAEGIVTGHPAMPQFKFQPAEIDALLGFIDSLAPPGAPDGAKRK